MVIVCQRTDKVFGSGTGANFVRPGEKQGSVLEGLYPCILENKYRPQDQRIILKRLLPRIGRSLSNPEPPVACELLPYLFVAGTPALQNRKQEGLLEALVFCQYLVPPREAF